MLIDAPRAAKILHFFASWIQIQESDLEFALVLFRFWHELIKIRHFLRLALALEEEKDGLISTMGAQVEELIKLGTLAVLDRAL